MDIETTGDGAVTVIVRGELDLAHAAGLRDVLSEVLNRGDVRTIDLDLGGVTFVDSAGVATLVVAERIATQVDVALRLTRTTPFTARLLGTLHEAGYAR